MRTSKKHILLLTLLVVISSFIVGVVLLTSSSSPPSASVKNFIASKNGNLRVEHIIALTEVSDKFDLVFYETSQSQIAANLLVKDEEGQYIDLIMTTSQPLDHVNHVLASSRLSYLSENTLYWGIAQSPAWTINHPQSHQIILDDIVLEYYFHNKSLDEEVLDLNFVLNES